MTPTNTDTAAKVYSKRFIAGLTRQLAPLKAFSLDLNQEAKQVGETIQYRSSAPTRPPRGTTPPTTSRARPPPSATAT